MKGGQNLAVLQQRKKDEEGWVLASPCCICHKVIKGAYANHGDAGWTCSGKCMKVQDQKPRYPGWSEEEFFSRQGVQDEVLDLCE